jgi:hypothetical protein
MTEVNSKRRSPARSGIATRRVITTTFESFDDWVDANNANYDINNLRRKADDFLEAWERAAFDVYRRHALPTFYFCWRNGPHGEWRPASERPKGPSKVGERFTTVDNIGAEAAPPDSEIGFATAILKRTQDARRRLKEADDPKVYRAFIDAAVIAQDFDLLHMEFGMASLLGPGRKQAAGRSQGGERGLRCPDANVCEVGDHLFSGNFSDA